MVIQELQDSEVCPEQSELVAFATGSLGEVLIDTIAEHIANCDPCIERLRVLDSEGSEQPIVDQLHSLEDPFAPYEDELESSQAIGRAKSIGSARDDIGRCVHDSQTSEIDEANKPTRAWVPTKSSANAPGRLVPQEEEIPVKIDRYFIVRELGSGGFGRVYLAKDPVSNCSVAIKVPRKDRITTDEAKQALLHEARLVAELDHPNIVPLLDCKQLEDGQCIVVMKYIDGPTLQEVLADGPVAQRRAMTVVAQIADALDYAHKRGIWHRDIKSSNILLDSTGTPFLTDFGLALHEDQQHLHQEEIAGTRLYMSPEQISGRSAELDGRTDIWSLGVVLYQLLARRRPFTATKFSQLRNEITTRPHRPVSSINATIPTNVGAICDRCLQKKAGDRYPTAATLAVDLRAAVTPTWRRIVPWVALVSCAVAVAVATFGLFPSRPLWADAKIVVWDPRNDHTDKRPAYNDKKRTYEFDTNAPTLLQVGSCEGDELILTASFEVLGADKIGYGGVFWGLDSVPRDNRIDACCWALQVGRPTAHGGVVLQINQHQIGPSGGIHEVLDTIPVIDVALNEVGQGNFAVELEVTRDQVVRVAVNGVESLEAPVNLKTMFGRDWRRLSKTGYGVIGQNGSFSFSAFSAH